MPAPRLEVNGHLRSRLELHPAWYRMYQLSMRLSTTVPATGSEIMPQLRQQNIYAEPIRPTPRRRASSNDKRTPKPLPTRYTFHAKKPRWVTKALKPGEAFHVKGSGKFCFRAHDLAKPYVVVT